MYWIYTIIEWLHEEDRAIQLQIELLKEEPKKFMEKKKVIDEEYKEKLLRLILAYTQRKYTLYQKLLNELLEEREKEILNEKK